MAFGRKRDKIDRSNASLFDVESKALRLLSMRDHGTNELRQKLRERGFPDEHIEQTLTYFKELRYLDDERVAKLLASSLKKQQWGPMKIRVKMREHHFDAQTIDDALEEHDLDEEAWVETALARVTRKFRKEPKDFDQNEREKAFRHLMYRGYPGSIARRVLF